MPSMILMFFKIFSKIHQPAAALVAAGEMEAAVQAYISALQYNPVSVQWAIFLYFQLKTLN